MLRPERMARALIVGPRDRLAGTIEALYRMQLLHVVDHQGEDETFRIGTPLPPASVHSESLVKLRSISSILQVPATAKPAARVDLATIREKIATLEINITEEAAAKKETEALLSDLSRRIAELRPFAALGLALEMYRGYESLVVIVGLTPRAIPEFDAKFPTSEAFAAEGVVAVFVPKRDFDPAQSFLSGRGFSRLEVPAGDGDPRVLLAASEADRAKWEARRAEAEARLQKLRQRYAGFVVAAQEALEIEVEKAEAPLRYAVSDHSFVADGWVPASRFDSLGALAKELGVVVERGATSVHGEDEPPVLLRNPRPVRPFEFFIRLYSTPSYREIDPTLFLMVFFPIFFGFMVGDAGYGALFLAIGVLGAARLAKESSFRSLLLTIGLGGFWALGFGLFVFGEAFGLPFHAPPPRPGGHAELDWARFGVFYPLAEPILHKTTNLGDMIYLSILAAFVHLSVSYAFGFVNEIGHNRRHALGKLGWLLVLLGLFTVLTQQLQWTRFGGWIWNVPLGWFPRDPEPLVSSFARGFPRGSFILLVAGGAIASLESVVAFVEIGGLLANVLSYARLAGIGVGKAAIAGAFNTLIIGGLIESGQLAYVALGWPLLVLAQLLVFLLGGISAGIQGIRLNYVESFVKFYEGNGTPFRPFGSRTPQEV